MRSTFDELATELNQVRALVASITPVNKVLTGHEDPIAKQYVTVRRRFDYAAFVVALYASFEKFIEDLVAGYARLESRRVQYADLPEKLVKKHLCRTAEMLLRGRLGEGRYADLREIDVVKNLFECLNGDTPYTLNDAAVIAHDSNLRAHEVDVLFAAVGIEQICGLARRSDAIEEWYCAAKLLPAPPQDGVPMAAVEERLKDIVDRRNQVAHRGGNPDELLGPDKMCDAIDFIEAFAKAVFGIAVGRYLQDHRSSPSQAVHLKQRLGDGPYKGGRVVVVDKPARRLFVGQPIFVPVEGTGARWGRIQSMRVDDTDVRTVDIDTVAANGVGIALDFRCPKGSDLVALGCDDDVVWSPVASG